MMARYQDDDGVWHEQQAKPIGFGSMETYGPVKMPGSGGIAEAHMKPFFEKLEEEETEQEEHGGYGKRDMKQYKGRGGIEPIDFIVSNKLDFLEGNVVKYVYRHPLKGGLDDLIKAQDYLSMLIKREREK